MSSHCLELLHSQCLSMLLRLTCNISVFPLSSGPKYSCVSWFEEEDGRLSRAWKHLHVWFASDIVTLLANLPGAEQWRLKEMTKLRQTEWSLSCGSEKSRPSTGTA